MKANPDIPVPTWNMLAYNDTVLVANIATEVWTSRHRDGTPSWCQCQGDQPCPVPKRQDGSFLYNLGSLIHEMEIRRGFLGMDLGFVATFGEKGSQSISDTLRFLWNALC